MPVQTKYFNRKELFRAAYKIKRKTAIPFLNNMSDDAIYIGNNIIMPGDIIFNTNEDYANLYLSKDSRTMMTKLAQPIAEGIALLLNMLIEKDSKSIFTVNQDGTIFSSKLYINEDYETNIFRAGVNYFKTKIDMERETLEIAAYDERDNLIKIQTKNNVLEEIKCTDKDFHFHTLNMMLPIFATFALIQAYTRSEYHKELIEFTRLAKMKNQEMKTSFIKLNEELYQQGREISLFTTYKDNNKDIEYEENKFPSAEPVIEIKPIPENIKFQLPEVLQFNNSEFSPEQQQQIPKLPPEFILPKEYEGLSNGIFTGDIKSVLFHGPAGTGKTANCKLICQRINLPIMEVINCSESSDESVLGKFIPEGDKVIFKQSKLTEAIKYGGAVVFEEINFSRPQHIAFLNSLLDDNGFVILDNGERINRHKNFRFFATMNYGYQGTRELNDATYNRFSYVSNVKELPVAAVKNMLVTRVPECSEYLNKIIKVYLKIKNMLNNDESNGHISPRNLENWARTARYEGYELAAEHTIVPCANFDTDMEKTIREVLKLYFV